MVVGVVILGGDADDDDTDEGEALSMRAVLLDTAADAAAAGAVAAAGVIIILTHAYWLDPAVALLVSLIVGYHATVLLKKITANLRPLVTPMSSYSRDV
jgi:Co/Zn/Cd efflux system component